MSERPPTRRPETLSALRRPPPRVNTIDGGLPSGEAERFGGRGRGPGTWLRSALTENLGLKLLSMILALTVYLLVNSDEHREINARVRVAYVLPPDKALVSERVDEVRVTIRGPWRRLKRFDEREIDRIEVDLTHVRGGEVPITPSMIDVPRGLEIISIEPKVVRIAFEDIATKQVAVVPSFAGRPMHGYETVPNRSVIDPPMITVRGAAGIVSALEGVRTQEIRVDGRSDDFTAMVPVLPPNGVEVLLDSPVQVTVAIEEQLVTRRLGAVPVAVRVPAGVDAARWSTNPETVDVTLTGGLVAVEAWIDRGVAATVDLTADAAVRGGRAVLPVTVVGAPAGVGVRVTPERVTVAPHR